MILAILKLRTFAFGVALVLVGVLVLLGCDNAPKDTTDKRYSSCAEAVKAGDGPYHRGKDAEYAWYRDPDNDGMVCE